MSFDLNEQRLNSSQAFLEPQAVEFAILQQDLLHSLPHASQRLASHLSSLGRNFDATIGLDVSKGRVPTLENIHQFALLIEADMLWRETFAIDLEPEFQHILAPPTLFNKSVLQQLRSFVTPDGQLNEKGFIEMRRVLDDLSRVEAEARKLAIELKRNPIYHSESGEFDIINDRYVLPVSSDHYTSTLGPIVHRSRTGQTLLIEPPQLKPYSLRRSELIAERDWLIFKKCRELGAIIASNWHVYDQWGEFAIQFDYLHALAAWGKRQNFSRPTIKSELGIELEQFFHPLISDCIKNDFSLTPTCRGVILSGPNTGGKTVLLKSLSLSVCLLRLGAWIPAQSASIYPYSQLFYFSHDLQDISEGLSSFSSEVKNYSELLEELNLDALVVIDEIFNSTSSEEASALAVALLEHMEKTSKPHVLLSTHHHGIKTTATTMSSYISGHMAVDSHGTPLYKVIWGSPGSSRGIETFKRLTHQKTWSKQISSRAKELLGSKVFDYESALSDLNAQRTEYLLMQQEADRQIAQLKNEREAFQLQKSTQLKKQQDELLKQYDQVISHTKKEIDRFKAQEISERKVLDTLSHGKRELSPEASKPIRPADLSDLPAAIEGLRVWSKTLGKSGFVVQDKKQKVLVDFKGLKSWCQRSDLMLRPNGNSPQTQVSIHVQRDVIGTTRFDGRGMRLERFQSDLMTSLHELLNGEIPYLDIVHGHGDGILKKWLRQYLQQERDFEWTPLDGNDGATRVQVKK